MDFNEITALLCEDFQTLPSILYKEECPRLFKVWRKLQKNKLNKVREDRLWSITIAPLYQSAMSKEGANQQSKYRDSLTRAIRDPEDVRAEDEYNSQQAERRLAALGVSVIKH